MRLKGGIGHKHITDVMWRSEATPAGLTSRQALVDWLSTSSSNRAVVLDSLRTVRLQIVRPVDEPPYLRAHAGGTWTDDPLAIPRF